MTDPVTGGPEPDARTDLNQHNRRPPWIMTGPAKNGRIAAGVVAMWVLIAGALAGIGKLIMITRNGNGNLLDDHAIPHWFAAHRTPALNHWSQIASNLGATGHPHRQRRYVRRVPRHHPALATGALRRCGHVRRTGAHS